MQLSRVTHRDALRRADYVETHTVGYPPRFVKALLSIRRVKFGVDSCEVVTVSPKLVPLLDGYTRIVVETLIGAVDQMVNGVSVVFEVTEP